jgi:hypothetical protein
MIDQPTVALTEAEVRKEFAEEDEHHTLAGIMSPHETCKGNCGTEAN